MHDDLLISAAMLSLLDEQDWTVSFPTRSFQAPILWRILIMVASNVRLFSSELLHFVFLGFFFVNKDFSIAVQLEKYSSFRRYDVVWC